MGDRMSSGAELLGPLLLREKYEDMEGWYGRLRTWPVCGAEETAMMYALSSALPLNCLLGMLSVYGCVRRSIGKSVRDSHVAIVHTNARSYQ